MTTHFVDLFFVVVVVQQKMALPFALSQFISSPQSHVSAALSKVPDYPKHLTGCLVSGPASR